MPIQAIASDLSFYDIFASQKVAFLKISDDVIAYDLWFGPPQSKILATPMVLTKLLLRELTMLCSKADEALEAFPKIFNLELFFCTLYQHFWKTQIHALSFYLWKSDNRFEPSKLSRSTGNTKLTDQQLQIIWFQNVDVYNNKNNAPVQRNCATVKKKGKKKKRNTIVHHTNQVSWYKMHSKNGLFWGKKMRML